MTEQINKGLPEGMEFGAIFANELLFKIKKVMKLRQQHDSKFHNIPNHPVYFIDHNPINGKAVMIPVAGVTAFPNDRGEECICLLSGEVAGQLVEQGLPCADS